MNSLQSEIFKILINEKNHEKEHLTKAMFDALPDEEKEKHLEGLRSAMDKHGVSGDSEDENDSEDDAQEGEEDTSYRKLAQELDDEESDEVDHEDFDPETDEGEEESEESAEESEDNTEDTEEESDDKENEKKPLIKLNGKKEKVKMNPTVKESLAMKLMRKKSKLNETSLVDVVKHHPHGEPNETYEPTYNDRLMSAYKKAIQNRDVVLMMKTKPLTDEKFVEEPIHTETLINVRQRDVARYKADGYVEVK